MLDPYREVMVMVELFEQNMREDNRQSSKGNQLKWENEGNWYKADSMGYEGLSEYLISVLLSYSSLEPEEYVSYQTEMIRYKRNQYPGCKSRNFLPEGWKLITLERLFQSLYGESLNKAIYSINDHTERVHFLSEQTARITGLREFGIYLGKLLTVDTFFLNEDRHTHNIAVLQDELGEYHYCPVFDNGAALLSDFRVDYPMTGAVEEMMQEAEAKTICRDFDEQLDIVEDLYGKQIQFCFDNKVVEQLLADEPYYPEEIKQRVQTIIRRQRRKYQYLFNGSTEN